MPDRSLFQLRPLYMQVYDNLVERISSVQWKPGQMIPSEQDLAIDLGVSTGTVRKALSLMQESQLIERRQGRGTFVVDQEFTILPIRFSNFYDADGVRHTGLVNRSSLTEGPCEAHELKVMKLQAGDICIRAHQTRSVNDEVVMSEAVSFSKNVFPDLDVDEDMSPRLAVLAQRRGIVLDHAIENVDIQPASQQAAADLGVKVGEKLLYVDRVILSSNQTPVEWRRGYCKLSANFRYRVMMR